MRVHLIGIGGYGMKTLAFFLKAKGYNVSGSDIYQSNSIDLLRKYDFNVWAPHNENILNQVNPDLVVYSLAVPYDNEELSWARSNTKKIFTRGQMLAKLMPYSNSVGITGTDGKTTTTSMIAEIFSFANIPYNLYVGGDTKYFNTDIVYDKNHTFIAEIDESDPDFKFFSPQISVVTNLRYDHMENYKNDKTQQYLSFKQFLHNSKMRIINESIREDFDLFNNCYTFGLNKGDLHIEDPIFKHFSSEFTVTFKNLSFKAKLNVPYFHNIENSLAAALVSNFIGLSLKDSFDYLYYYEGVKRRFEIKYRNENNNIYIIDDYAHNPYEVFNTVNAAKLEGLDLVVVFQPHRYSRFKAEWKNFVTSLSLADEIIITDIFGAYEKSSITVTPNILKNELVKKGKNAFYMEDFECIAEYIFNKFKKNVVILTLGAGTITNLCDNIVKLYV